MYLLDFIKCLRYILTDQRPQNRLIYMRYSKPSCEPSIASLYRLFVVSRSQDDISHALTSYINLCGNKMDSEV